MAKDTDLSLRNAVMYSAFIRNHTKEGTFLAFAKDLDRIKELGVDIIWLMPIHPVGEEKRKGADGSPYAIKDYRAVNPEYGTKEDFIFLVEEIHKRGMKCIIDMVYNHTSPDSCLVKEHPEYFYQKADGSFGNHIGDWNDIIDLDYTNKKLWDYQIETLKMWAQYVDGFRCDVAPMVPIEFWEKAREEVAKVHPGCIWLAESGHFSFIKHLRDRGLVNSTDYDLYRAFDLCYDYDVHPALLRYLEGKISLETYAYLVEIQEGMYPQNFVRLRFLENHDNERIASLVLDKTALLNWTAFSYFEKGTTLLYEGQEYMASHRPSIFDKDTIDWDTKEDISSFLQALYRIKKEKHRQGAFLLSVQEKDEVLLAGYRDGETCLYGVFSMKGRAAEVSVLAEDNTYENLIDGSKIVVQNGKLSLTGMPVCFYAALRKKTEESKEWPPVML